MPELRVQAEDPVSVVMIVGNLTCLMSSSNLPDSLTMFNPGP